ncbi:DUF3025 domain-containing protein [Moraxella boevrei]|uniref:DUF3025 domain-containing protein n=1 Tax=Faucicola boevrei TaxID=346665 RepID=UPI0037363C24
MTHSTTTPLLTVNQLLQTIDFRALWYQNLKIPSNFFVKINENIGENPKFNFVYELLNFNLEKLRFNTQYSFSNFQNLPLFFEPQNALPLHTAYESFIADTGNIPTRDNFHDLLNGLIWLNFPNTKVSFNRLHACDIEQHGIDNTRTPLRNALTLFDENGGVIVSNNQQLLTNLQNFDWETAFITKKNHWQNTQFFAVGHALLEKLIRPRKNITAHTLLILVDDAWQTQNIDNQRKILDVFLANLFLKQTLHSKMFQPLPILGIPNFAPKHGYKQDLVFYQDRQVFRQKRQGEPANIWQLNTNEWLNF